MSLVVADVSHQFALPDGGIRPPLKWAGGKRWLVPHLRSYWSKHKHRRLVEPFCGGLAVVLGLLPERALLNDINPHAINLYQHLKKGLKPTLKMLNDEKYYYLYRDQFNDCIRQGKWKTRKAADLFYYLNRTGYNGLCRFNQQGEYNVPFGRYAKINYITDFRPYQQILQNWEFSAVDFESLVLAEDDFVYADPPYDVEFTQYAKEGFGWSDQVRLAEWLSRHKGPVILSNQATGRIVDLYKSLGFELQLVDAPRMISCTGDRARAREVVALKGV